MPAPFDLSPFRGLEDRLLRGGIAPRHVKRYLRELTEHLTDLTEAQRAAGFDADDAAIRARAALGPDEELADAMLKQRDFRALSARFPWLVFGVMPPLALIFGFVLWVMAVVLVGVSGGAIVPDHHTRLPVPGWYDWTASVLVFAANFLIPCLLGCLLAWMAQRQRMKPLWPLLGMALILVLSVHASFHADATGRIFLGLATILPIKGPFGPGGPVSLHWPTFLIQAALLCLPVAWLLYATRKIGAPQ